MKNKEIAALILAAGKGTRMLSDHPKVMHKLAGKPLISYVLDTVEHMGIKKIYVIVGYKANEVMSAYKQHDIQFVLQKEQLGTGHAVMQAEHVLEMLDATVLVLNGDTPLISASTLNALIEHHHNKKASATVLTANLEDPLGYGRIIRDPHHDLEKIVEQKDGSLGELEIKEINTGTYCFECKDLFWALQQVRPENSQHEYYLTDVIYILKHHGKRVSAFCTDDSRHAMGINTKDHLAQAEKILRGKQ